MGYRIFISSTMEDLEEEQYKISIELMKSQNIPIMAEFNKCEGYIGIFHKRWEYIPEKDDPDNLSVTTIEYGWAKKRNILRLILKSTYKKDDELTSYY
jgi:hypothetical protein